MAKTIRDYPISFPYGATSAPYSSSHPHRGNDRAAPCGTPIVVEGSTIGWVGSTGLSTGCHLHTQGARPGGYTTFKPNNYEFKGGKVVESGVHPDFGNYVRIRVTPTVDIIYAHLSKRNVKVGQEVGKKDVEKDKEIAKLRKERDFWKKAAIRNRKGWDAAKRLYEAAKKKLTGK